jgi:hypothetical protein
MKNQYFGDINDYFKYGLLRLITKNTNLKIGVCWMLTENDTEQKQNDGNKTKYLLKPNWRCHDPALFDFLKSCVDDNNRNVIQIESSQMLPSCKFHEEILKDDKESRQQYFANLKNNMKDCDLLFFDPDNGMQIPSTHCGNKGSSKFLYWNEAKELFDFDLGHSLIIFQHHRRVEYKSFVDSLINESIKNTGIRPQFFYRTKYSTLFLIAQKKHITDFQKVDNIIKNTWQDKIKYY